MNKNGLCGEVGLIIIRFKSVKAFSQISPRRCWVKNPFAGSVPWQRARLPGDRGYDSRECASVSVGWGYIYAWVCVCASVCTHVCGTLRVCKFESHWSTQAHKHTQTNTKTRVIPFLLSFFFFLDFKSGSVCFQRSAAKGCIVQLPVACETKQEITLNTVKVTTPKVSNYSVGA